MNVVIEKEVLLYVWINRHSFSHQTPATVQDNINQIIRNENHYINKGCILNCYKATVGNFILSGTQQLLTAY
jgi:hypothetical protein